MEKIIGLVISDNVFVEPQRTCVARSTGAHRLATLLRSKSISVEVLDFFNFWTLDELKLYIEKFKSINFLAISSTLVTLESYKVNYCIYLVKKINPNCKIIAGGAEIIKNRFNGIDIFFKGFAEGAVDDIVDYIKTGNKTQFNFLSSKHYNFEKIVNCGNQYPMYDLTSLKTEYMPNDFIDSNETLTIELSRGCIFKCKFCSFPLTGKKKNDYIRSKEDIKQEFIGNYLKYGTTKYFITDDTLNDNIVKIDLLHEISQELDFKLKFMCFIRVDLLNAYPDTLPKLVEAGVRGMYFGIETLNPDAARVIGKKFTGSKLIEYLKEIRKNYPNLHLTSSFIIGLADESPDDVEKNINLLLENKLFDNIIVYPLMIHRNFQINDLSPFSTHWHEYGYQEMSDEELAETKPYYSGLHWKNATTNILEAKAKSDAITKQIQLDTTRPGWYCWTTAYNNFDLETVLTSTKRQLPWAQMKEDAAQFMNKYKQNKIASDLN